ncbi:SpoIIE family protein phosphatase [uncultured Eubacterium sp.]|uniref:SpoIIE family protein phosphatase n=1 Tax=uncultured Eubacterium sp. TaxID=165185 RepID=UPI0025CBD229|nr:SpoIIE family protein phosphatase [uncultured Eubacterium sp.]
MEVKIKKRLEENVKSEVLKRVGIFAGYFFAGLITSFGSAVGGLKPFGVALTASARKKGYIFSAFGAVFGYLLTGFNAQNVRYMCAVILTAVGAFLIELLDAYHNPLFSIAIGTVSVLSTGIFVNIRLSAGSEAYFLLLAETMLSAGVTYCYYKAINANFRQMRFKALPISELAYIIISVSTLFLSLGNVAIWRLYPIRIIAVVLVLTATYYAGERLGMILSLSLGFVLGVHSKEALFLCGAFGFSTLVAGLFSSTSIFSTAGAFLASITFFSIATGEEVGLSLFLDGIIGSLIFVLMPTGITDKIEKFFDLGTDLPPDGTLRQNLVLKLRFASNAMSAISDSVDEVRERINDVTRRQNEAMRDTMSDTEYITREIILEKTNQIRMVASDQFISISGMLNDLAKEFDEAEIFDCNASNKIRRLLGEYEIYPTNISAIVDKYGRMRVEILLSSSSAELTGIELKNEIGKICNRYFDTGRITNFKNESMLSFSEKPNYSLEVGFAQFSAEGELCGDTVKIINDSKGHSILIISDGMGKGSRAALDGAMGAGLLSKLINSGFGFDSALKIVNSALLVKSNDESLATLDIANIDLFTGKCELFKAGAPASYIIKDGRLTKCELTSMPAGILRGIEFAKRTAVLSLGDSIILMSDGITDLGERWLKDTISAMPNSVQEGADYILSCAKEEMKDKKADDMSIIFARLERN